MSRAEVDRQLLDALAVLDDAADGRGVNVGLDVGVARSPGARVYLAPGIDAGVTALEVTLCPLLHGGRRDVRRAVVLRAPYNDRTHEWIRALGMRLRAAHGWNPHAWGRQAAEDVLGTVEGSAEDMDTTVERAPESRQVDPVTKRLLPPGTGHAPAGKDGFC